MDKIHQSCPPFRPGFTHDNRFGLGAQVSSEAFVIHDMKVAALAQIGSLDGASVDAQLGGPARGVEDRLAAIKQARSRKMRVMTTSVTPESPLRSSVATLEKPCKTLTRRQYIVVILQRSGQTSIG